MAQKGCFVDVFSTWPEPVWVFSPALDATGATADFLIEYANPASRTLLGSNATDPQGRYLRELVPPRVLREVLAGVRSADAEDGAAPAPILCWPSPNNGGDAAPRCFEVRASRSEGQILSIWRGVASGGEQPKPPNGESLLKQNEKKYRSIFELSGLSLWEEDISELRAELKRLKNEGVSDIEAHLEKHPEFLEAAATMIKVIDVNETTVRLYGANRKEELLGPISLSLLLDEPLGRKSLVENVRAIAEGTTYTERESLVVTRDGKRMHILINAYIPDEEDPFPHMLVAIVDITERKRSEERIRDLARLADESPNPVLRVSLHGTVSYANPSAWPIVLAITGAEGFRIEQEHMQVLSSAWARGEKLETAIMAGERTYSFTVVPIASGEYINLYGKDITDEKALAEGFLRSQKLEAVGRLAAGVAHDFNNILTTIQGCSEMIREELPPEVPAYRYATEVRLAAERAATLTRQLLAFSRGQVLQARLVDLNLLLGRIERMLARLIGEDIALLLTLADDLWPIWVDPHYIEQIAMALAVNARDAMPRGGRLHVGTKNVLLSADQVREHRDTAPGEYVAVSLRDTGVGMDSQTMSHLFEPFFTTKEPGHGMGLGLSTVQEMVKQSLGSIWISSEEGKGTTITLYFPRADRRPEPSRTDS